jgi:hypothetical protein
MATATGSPASRTATADEAAAPRRPLNRRLFRPLGLHHRPHLVDIRRLMPLADPVLLRRPGRVDDPPTLDRLALRDRLHPATTFLHPDTQKDSDRCHRLLDAAETNVQICAPIMHERFPGEIFAVSPLSSAAGHALTLAFKTGDIRRFLEHVLNDPKAASTCAARSFPHPLGFLKIVLTAYPNGAKLRLHVWPDGREHDVEQDIHDHFWDFCSIVLNGEMEFVDFLPADDGDDYFHYRLYPNSPSGYKQVFLGNSYLSSRAIHRLSVGDSMCVSRMTLHRAYPTTSGLCATLLLQGPQQSSCNNIYSSTYEVEANKIVSEQPISQTELMELLGSVVALLPNQPAS